MIVSLCLMVRNEETALPGCLQSAADLVDEIIVVDTGFPEGPARDDALRKCWGDYLKATQPFRTKYGKCVQACIAKYGK